MQQLAYATFGPGGPGAVLVQLMLIAVVSWLLHYIASATGREQIAGMIKVVATFVSIAMVAGVVWRAVLVVAGIAGLN